MKHILILILCAFVLSCKSTKTISSSNESERNAVSQVQWRSAQNLSFSTLQRLTALSFDSCVFTFGGADTSATPQCSDISYPSGKPCPITRLSLPLRTATLRTASVASRTQHHVPHTASRPLSDSTDFTFPKRKRRSPQLHSRWKTASQQRSSLHPTSRRTSPSQGLQFPSRQSSLLPS